jgi:autotransporter strand-loop-strand O-heptosyltransferase
MKVEAYHILIDTESEREKQSIKLMSQISNFGIGYNQYTTKRYTNDAWKLQTPLSGWMNHGPSHFGLYQSFKNIILNNFTDDLDALLIFEADCVLYNHISVEQFRDEVYKALDFCKKHNVLMFSFGDTHVNGVLQSPTVFEDSDYADYFITDKIILNHCILIPNKARDVVMNALMNDNWDVMDLWFNRVFRKYKEVYNLNMGIVKNPLTYQYEGVSMIDDVVKTTYRNIDVTKRKKILYIADHLSTGGMPEMLKIRISSLLEEGSWDIWCVEYSLYSINYVAQRNSISEMLGNKFISLGWFSDDNDEAFKKYEHLKALIERENFDIIHFDDSPETYNSFNKIDKRLLEFIYTNPNKTWKVVETTHNSHFDANIHKEWIPDGFMHCSKFMINTTFSKFNDLIPTTIIEFPIWERNTNHPIPDKFDASKFNIVNVGIWTAGKNQKEALEIARYLDLHYPNKFLFHFVGPVAPNFKNYWEPLLSNLPSNVIIWDEQKNTEPFYQWADLVLFNSTYELNPIVLKEAVGYKVPLLMRNLPVYYNAYDEYASYLTGDVEPDSIRLVEMVTNKPKLNYKFNDKIDMAVQMIKFYEKIQNVNQQNLQPLIISNPDITHSINFNDGPFVEITGISDDKRYNVKFIDKFNNVIRYKTDISVNHWTKSTIRYYVDWSVEIQSNDENKIVHNINLENKIVLIQFDSAAVGDTLAWIPYVEEFRKKHNCKIYCSTFHNHLFRDVYTEINFVNPGDVVDNIYAKYTLGWFYTEDGSFDNQRHPNNFVNQPLQKTASDILGLEYTEIVPRIRKSVYSESLPKRYFTFSLQSTAQSKYWNYPNGWKLLLDKLSEVGLIGVCVDKHTSFGISGSMNVMPNNCIDKTGLSLEDIMGIISGAEFHIGISSGLSWLAWALETPLVLISGFTDPIMEPTTNCIRIHNPNVCNGCFTNPKYKFDKSDWMWCPVHKGTDRQFECTKRITPDDIFKSMYDGGLLKKEEN